MGVHRERSRTIDLATAGNWRLHREKKTGQVHYALWQRG